MDPDPAEDASAIEAAHKKLSQKQRSRFSFPKLRTASSAPDVAQFRPSVRKRIRSHTKRKQSDENGEQENGPTSQEIQPTSFDLSDITVHVDESLDSVTNLQEKHPDAEFRWAILYENQRGLTLFSIPYYSRQSLLPVDPFPFTIPSASPIPRKKANSTLSLQTYPLPSGDWRWVSKTWMIDMRSADDGEVGYDGFQYNSMGFKRRGWRSTGSGFAWVRRRRWIRLMYRPAAGRTHEPSSEQPSRSSSVAGPAHSSISVGSFAQSSFWSRQSLKGGNIDPFMVPTQEVFPGQDPDADFAQCSALLHLAGRDGKKIELWEQWLGVKNAGAEVEPERGILASLPSGSNSNSLSPNISARREGGAITKAISSVLRTHASDILHLLIYPASRARLLYLLSQADSHFLTDMNVGLGPGWSSADIDFWSYYADTGTIYESMEKNDTDN